MVRTARRRRRTRTRILSRRAVDVASCPALHGSGVSTLDSLFEAVRALDPIIRRHAAEAERERRLSAPVVEALRAAGLYRMLRPKALGGLEVDPMTAFRVIEEASRIDSAVGW